MNTLVTLSCLLALALAVPFSENDKKLSAATNVLSAKEINDLALSNVESDQQTVSESARDKRGLSYTNVNVVSGYSGGYGGGYSGGYVAPAPVVQYPVAVPVAVPTYYVAPVYPVVGVVGIGGFYGKKRRFFGKK